MAIVVGVCFFFVAVYFQCNVPNLLDGSLYGFSSLDNVIFDIVFIALSLFVSKNVHMHTHT